MNWTYFGLGAAAYLGAGIVIVSIIAFFDGVQGRRTDINTVPVLFLWPLFVVSEIVPAIVTGPIRLFKVTNAVGLKVNKRRMARKHSRQQRKDFKELCRREGWPFRKMWKAQREKLTS